MLVCQSKEQHHCTLCGPIDGEIVVLSPGSYVYIYIYICMSELQERREGARFVDYAHDVHGHEFGNAHLYTCILMLTCLYTLPMQYSLAAAFLSLSEA